MVLFRSYMWGKFLYWHSTWIHTTKDWQKLFIPNLGYLLWLFHSKRELASIMREGRNFPQLLIRSPFQYYHHKRCPRLGLNSFCQDFTFFHIYVTINQKKRILTYILICHHFIFPSYKQSTDNNVMRTWVMIHEFLFYTLFLHRLLYAIFGPQTNTRNMYHLLFLKHLCVVWQWVNVTYEQLSHPPELCSRKT